MEVLRCGSCNYLILFNFQRREFNPQLSLFDYLFNPFFRTNEKTSPQIACLPLPKKSREDMISFPPDDGDIVTARRIRAAPLVFTARQKPIIPLPRRGANTEMPPALK